MPPTPAPIPGVSPGIELLPLLRPYVRHCGNTRRPAWHIERRRLLDYLLVYIEEGRGLFEIGGQIYKAEANDLFWIPPNTIHAMEGYPPSMVCPYVHFDLFYRPESSHWDFSIPAGMLDLKPLRPLLHPPLKTARMNPLCGLIRGHTNRRVGGLINEICAEAARAQPYACLRLSGLMLEIVAEIMRGRAGLAAQFNEHIPLLEEAAAYMLLHCARNLPLKELADLCQLSISHFRRLFSLHYGCSPRAYLRRARIQKAKGLMMGSALNFSEIAERLGFATVHSFSRAFHEVEGLSPSEYRLCGSATTRVEGRQVPYSH